MSMLEEKVERKNQEKEKEKGKLKYTSVTL